MATRKPELKKLLSQSPISKFVRLTSASTDVRQSLNFMGGTFFGVAFGFIGTILSQYFWMLLRRPRLNSIFIRSDVQKLKSNNSKAFHIATENLQTGLAERSLENQKTKQVLHAGYRNFREIWARDFGFAIYGLMALRNDQPVKETLEAFFEYQTPIGQLPVKLASMNVLNRFIHSLFRREQPIEGDLTPKYITGHRTVSLDGQALLVAGACQYILTRDDRVFALEYWEPLQQAVRWLQNYTHPGSDLLSQEAYADWADSVARRGVVLYTNVVYWKALWEMARLAAYLGHAQETRKFQEWAEKLRLDILSHLWRTEGGYLATSLELENLSSAGNLLAVAWGIVEQDKAGQILDAIQSANMADPVPTQVAYPAYNPVDIALENRLGGLGNYHTEGAWLWIGAWHAIALHRAGRSAEARQILQKLANLLVRDGQVYEVYGLDGQPLSSFWYTSEAPLTWNAALIVYAFQVLKLDIDP